MAVKSRFLLFSHLCSSCGEPVAETTGLLGAEFNFTFWDLLFVAVLLSRTSPKEESKGFIRRYRHHIDSGTPNIRAELLQPVLTLFQDTEGTGYLFSARAVQGAVSAGC